VKIQAPYTAAVQTEFETLTGPYVTMPVINVGQQDTVIIKRNTVKSKSPVIGPALKTNLGVYCAADVRSAD